MTDQSYNYQTITEFLASPFNLGQDIEKDRKYYYRYKELMSKSKIYVEGYTSISDDYYIHLKIPSESNDTMYYDVVIRFFYPATSKLTDNLKNYYIQFFSNSPGFMFKYAVLYKINGYLIEDLYNKMDPEYMDTLPTKSNPNLKLDNAYDSTIYFACKFLSEHNFMYLSKFGIILQKKKTPDEFFKAISMFKDVKQKMDDNKKKASSKKITVTKTSTKRTSSNNLKRPVKNTSTSSSGIHVTVKKTGSNNIRPKKRAVKKI